MGLIRESWFVLGDGAGLSCSHVTNRHVTSILFISDAPHHEVTHRADSSSTVLNVNIH